MEIVYKSGDIMYKFEEYVSLRNLNREIDKIALAMESNNISCEELYTELGLSEDAGVASYMDQFKKRMHGSEMNANSPPLEPNKDLVAVIRQNVAQLARQLGTKANPNYQTAIKTIMKAINTLQEPTTKHMTTAERIAAGREQLLQKEPEKPQPKPDQWQ